MASVYTVAAFDVNVRDCVCVCLFVSVLLPVCEYLSVSEMKSDQYFILCLFTERTCVYFRPCLCQPRSLFDAVSFYREVI